MSIEAALEVVNKAQLARNLEPLAKAGTAHGPDGKFVSGGGGGGRKASVTWHSPAPVAGRGGGSGDGQKVPAKDLKSGMKIRHPGTGKTHTVAHTFSSRSGGRTITFQEPGTPAIKVGHTRQVEVVG